MPTLPTLKVRPSSRLAPTVTGTWAKRPSRTAARGSSGSVAVPRTNMAGVPADTSGGKATQAVEQARLVGAAGRGRDPVAGRFRFGLGPAHAAPALDHRAGEQPAGAGGGQVRADRPAAGRLPADGHAPRVTAERGDVPPHPPQRGLLVRQTVVAGLAPLGGQRGVAQEAEDPAIR